MKQRKEVKKLIVLYLLCVFFCMMFSVNAEQQTDAASFSVSASFIQKDNEKVACSENPVETVHEDRAVSNQMQLDIQSLYFRQDIRQVKTQRSLRNFYAIAVAIVFFPTLLFLCVDYNCAKKYAKLWKIVVYIHDTDGKKRR